VTTAGYSGTPLDKKLGIKAGHRVLLSQAPDDLPLTLPDGVTVVSSARGAIDVALLFTTSQSDMRKRMPAVCKVLAADGGLWVCWPKKASKVPTDLTENDVRQAGFDHGLVDNKVCAVTDVWSGLRLVVRLADRARWNR
jgi:hypothetical protein